MLERSLGPSAARSATHVSRADYMNAPSCLIIGHVGERVENGRLLAKSAWILSTPISGSELRAPSTAFF